MNDVGCPFVDLFYFDFINVFIHDSFILANYLYIIIIQIKKYEK